MLNKLIRCTLLSLITSTASVPLFAAAEHFIIDDQHSYVLWHVKHLGFSTQAGKWYVKGTLDLDKQHPEQSKVNIDIDMNNLVTGLPELDKHLKSPSFFDVARFPKATFVSDKVEVLKDNTAKVTGQLTLHGVSKPVTLMVTLNKEGKNPLSDNLTVGFTASTQLKRSDFGMTTLLPNLGDEVGIEIGAEAYQPKEKP